MRSSLARYFAHMVTCVLLTASSAIPASGALPHGPQAIVGATLVPRPGEVIVDATIVMRDGRIETFGPRTDVEVPEDARVHDGAGLFVYAGFIEAWSEYEMALGEIPERDGPEADPGRPGPSSPHVRLHPELRVVDGLVLSDKRRDALRSAGFTTATLVPDDGVLRGRAAIVELGEGTPEQSVVRPEAGVAVSYRGARWGADRYPGSIMGAIAATRQAFFDAAFHRSQSRKGEAEYDPSADALLPVLERKQPLLVETQALVLYERVRELGEEHGIRTVLLGTGHEWRRPELVPAGVGLVLPVDFPDRPEVADDGDWVQVGLDELRQWEFAPENPGILRARGHRFAITTHGLKKPRDLFAKLRAAQSRGFSEDDALAALTIEPAELYDLQKTHGVIAARRPANLTVLRGSLLDEKVEVALLFVNGRPIELARDDAKRKSRKTEDAAAEEFQRIARHPGEDRGVLADPSVLLVKNATLWTCGPEGVIEGGDLLVRDGRIAAIGRGLEAKGAMVVDANGRHVTPGLIDAHAHIAAVGGVNEGTVSCSAEVRIRDVINSEDARIYEQLAGGLTVSHVLHGSANAIGGQCQAIKLRWGATPSELLFAAARPTIKFALGENPKRGNSYERGRGRRYPQSRLGVEDVIRERFVAAREYREAFARGEVARDLQLEALLEILDDERDIHCHSYRQDEILMLMRLMESFDARVAVFTHVLEGYKVADELAAHGAGASTFADWWAYKLEVYDAIPQNTTILHERGVVTGVNSDSADLARRMNREAAKSVRHGGTDPETALKFATLYPAQHIGAADRVGSLEVGKDADFVVWNGPPLGGATVADQTWVDGKLYFDRSIDAERHAKIFAEYEALVQRAKDEEKRRDEGAESGEESADDRYRYHAPAELEWAARNLGCNDLHVHEGSTTEVQR